MLRVMADMNLTDEMHSAFDKARSVGGLTILRDNNREEIDRWIAHAGTAVVLAPHEPSGVEAARHAMKQRTMAGAHRGGSQVLVVTIDWVYECLLRSKWLSTSRHPLFRPCPHKVGTCTISCMLRDSPMHRLDLKCLPPRPMT